MHNWYVQAFIDALVNTLAEKEFVEFIASKMNERETRIIMNKRLEIAATSEFADLFRNSNYHSRKLLTNMNSEENGKFYQYLSSNRKRSYKQIENDSELLQIKNNELLDAKKKLEANLEDMYAELKWHQDKDNAEIDFKRKLEELQKEGVLNENFNPT